MRPESRPRVDRLRGICFGLLPVLLVTFVWRLPSFFDPPWVNDEGTYFAVATSMAHGYRLYARIWENKPPGIYLLFEAVYRQFGTSLISVRVAALLAVCVSTTCAFLIARHLLTEAAGAGAALFVGLFFGTPFLEGTTANAEVFTSALCALGVYFWFVRGWPLLAGVAVALAILFKSVAAFDAAAIGLWLLIHDRASFVRYAASLILVLGVAMGAAAAMGILTAMIRDAFLYDVGYVGHANGGMVPWVLYAKLTVLVVLTIWFLRTRFVYLWLVYAVAGALLSGRVFGHYFLQAGVPFALAMFLWLRLDRFHGAQSWDCWAQP